MGRSAKKNSRLTKREPGIFEELGRTGLQRYGGIISEEWDSKLQGLQGIKVYTKMATNEAIIAGMLYAAKTLATQVPVFVKPLSDDPLDIKAAEFYQSCFYDMDFTWPQTMNEILSCMELGWSFLEINYKYRRGPRQKEGKFRSQYKDGRVSWKGWAPRAQDSLQEWKYLEGSDKLLGWIQSAPPDYEEIFLPITKGLLFRVRGIKGNPEGTSLLRGCVRSWLNKTRIEDLEGIGAERDLPGYPVLYVPGDIADPDPDDEASLAANEDYLKVVTKTRRDEMEGILLPSECYENGQRQYELKLVAAPGTRQFDTTRIITRYETRMALTLLADFMLLGSQRQGSYALSETKAKLFTQGLTAILDEVFGVINAYARPKLFEYNPEFDDLDELPPAQHGKLDTPTLEQLANYIKNLSEVLSIKDDLLVENHLRGQADLPLKPVAPPDIAVGPQPSENTIDEGAEGGENAKATAKGKIVVKHKRAGSRRKKASAISQNAKAETEAEAEAEARKAEA